MKQNEFTDEAAKFEARRVLSILVAHRRHEAAWLGHNAIEKIDLNEDSAFYNGMLALFRHARGEAVPAFIVQDFTDELLKLMFCGLANNTMALPPFHRMEDKPWANAWRLSELRMGFEGDIELDVPQLSHLLGESPKVISNRLLEHGFDPSGIVPAILLKEIYDALKQSLCVQS